ncbi:hypothetical protein EROP_21410 [Erysipelotrichaceae bacterium OPF54]|nr:hypothetical protein EROP_21410 [Erysipelotrichaceae bacterium OPF54]
MSNLFMSLGLLTVLLSNYEKLETAGKEFGLFTFAMIVVFSILFYLLKKFKAIEKEKYVLILGLGVFDVFCSLFFRLNWLSYALQIVVVAAYFVYEQRRIKVRG